MPQILPSNTFTTAKWIVSSTLSNGTHTTIGAALTSASSGDTIFVRPGTYTENPTLVAGVNLCAYECDAQTPNVIINGTCTATFAGSCTLSGIQLQTNSANSLVVSGSSATVVNLVNCYYNCLNNTGISFSSSSASARINSYQCFCSFGTTSVTLYTASSPGRMTFDYLDGSLVGSSGPTVASSTSAAFIDMKHSTINFPLSTSATGQLSLYYVSVQTANQNTTSLTTAGSVFSQATFCDFESGSASAISVGTGTILTCANCTINSSNSNPVTGTGSFKSGGIVFTGSSSLINPTTVTNLSTSGSWQLISTQNASSSANINFTGITPGYTTYMLVVTNLSAATGTSTLQLLYSTNGGSSYLATGYEAGLNYNSWNSATLTNVNATTFIPLSPASLGTSGGYFCNVIMYGLGISTLAQLTGQFSMNGNQFGYFGCGYLSAIVVNAIRLQCSSGNIASGTFSLYGLAE